MVQPQYPDCKIVHFYDSVLELKKARANIANGMPRNQAVQPLLPLLDSDSPLDRIDCVRALSSIGTTYAADLIAGQIRKESDPFTGRVMIAYLRFISPRLSVPRLCALLDELTVSEYQRVALIGLGVMRRLSRRKERSPFCDDKVRKLLFSEAPLVIMAAAAYLIEANAFRNEIPAALKRAQTILETRPGHQNLAQMADSESTKRDLKKLQRAARRSRPRSTYLVG